MKFKYCGIMLFSVLMLFSCATYRHSGYSESREFRLAAVGDSITYGLGIENRYQNSYPAQLENKLGPRWVVANFGKSGTTLLSQGDHPYTETNQFTDVLDFNPDMVIIMLGTNDSKPQNRIYLDDFAEEYIQLINRFQSLSSKPLICICYPVPAFDGIWGIEDRIITEHIIPAIKEVAEKSGVLLIDLNSALRSRSDLFPDTVHPDTEGARLIADTIFFYLRENLSSSFYDRTSYYQL